jgi:hypothetical protein
VNSYVVVGQYLDQAIAVSRWITPTSVIPGDLNYLEAGLSGAVRLPLIVEAALHPTVNAADRQAIGLVEVFDGLPMLILVHLDDQPELRPDSVKRKRRSSRPRRAWVASAPVEPHLPGGLAPRSSERISIK